MKQEILQYYQCYFNCSHADYPFSDMAIKFINHIEYFTCTVSTTNFNEYDQNLCNFLYSLPYYYFNIISYRPECFNNTSYSFTGDAGGVVETFGSFVVGGNVLLVLLFS